MKKSYLYIAGLLALAGNATTAFAQDDAQAPNRMLVVDSNGYYNGYVVDYVGDIRFTTVEGEVLAEVEIKDVELDRIGLSIVRTPACIGFKLAIAPTSIVGSLNDVAAIRYTENNGTETYYQDFTEPDAALTGIELKAGLEYTILTVGYDTWGIASGVFKVSFETPGEDIVGNPYVDVTLDDISQNYATLTFIPNDDVLEYYFCEFDGGTIESYFDMMGAWMGFTSISEMIAGWGFCENTPFTYKFDYLDPGMTYDIGIAVKDLNGNFAPYQTFTFTTTSIGGEGPAYVDIEVGDYELADWWGEIKPSQFFYYYPNENTARYRFEVYLAEVVEEFGLDEIISQVCSEPPMPGMAYWYFYEPMYTDYQLDPSTEVYVIAGGQNTLDEWGEVNVLNYTTPDVCEGWSPEDATEALRKASASKDNKIAKRIVAQKNPMQAVAKAPQLRQPKKMGLTQ